MQFLGTPTSAFTGGITFPIGLAEDTSGNVYIDDYSGNIVYKETLQSNGTYVRSTIDSGFPYGPVGLAIDSAGNVYVGIDIGSTNSSLVKETLQGNGTYVRSYIGTGLEDVYGIAVDSSGNVYATNNSGAENVYKFMPSGSAYDAGSVIFTSPGGILAGLALDSIGNVFITKEYASAVYKLTPSGSPATTTSYTSSTIATTVGSAFDITVDGSGDLWIADTSGFLRLETPDGGNTYTETVVASGLGGSYGATIGPTGTVYFSAGSSVDEFSPTAVNLGSANLNVASSTTTLVFTVQASTVVSAINVVSEGVVNTQTGSPEFVNARGGTCVVQTYSNLAACTVKVKFTPQFTGLQTGALQFLDASNNVLSEVPLYGVGTAPVAGFSAGTASLLSVTGLGSTPLSSARHPVMDVAGNLYIADSGNNRIVEVAPGGVATVLNTPSFTLDAPTAVAIDGAGNLYIADSGNGRVVELTAQGVASALDTNSLALATNYGVAVDRQGNVYTSDATNNRVIEFPYLGSAQVLATTGVTLGSAYGVAADAVGNIYIADESNSQIVKVSGGTGSDLGMGTLSPVLLNPTDVAVDAPGNVYVTDSGNNRIVEVSSGTTSAMGLGTGSFALNYPTCAIVGNVEDLYICDSENNRIVTSDLKAAAALTFATPITTQQITLLNLGNSPLTLSVPVSGQNPGFGTGNFVLLGAGNAGYCPQLSTTSSAGSVAAGANCLLNVEFAPIAGASGILTDTLTVTDNNLRVAASTQSISLTGTAVPTPTVTLTPSPAAPIVYGQAQTSLGVAVSYTSGTPTGAVGFTDSSNSLGSAITLSAGSGALAAQYYQPGAHSFQASYSGDGSFKPALSSVVAYTVNQASSTLGGPSTAVQVVHGVNGTIPVLAAGQYSGAGIALPSGAVGYSIAGSGNIVVASGTAPIASGTATVPVANTLASGVYTVTLNYPGDANYNAAAAATVNLSIGTITPAINWTQPALIAYGTTLSGILNATATSNSASVPGSFVYAATLTGGSASTVTSASVLGAGVYTLTATFAPTDASSYNSASGTVSLTVNKAAPVLSWSAPTAIAYGATLSGILNATAASNSASVPGSFAYTATPTGGSASTVTSASVLGAGAYTLTAAFTPTDTSSYASVSSMVSLTVNKAVPTVALVSSADPVLVTNAITFTVTITSTAGTPAGSVSFLDKTTLLGSVTLSSGVASYTTSSLAVATHSITAVFSGSSNFVSATTSAVAEVVQDFSLSVSGSSGSKSPSQTVVPGGTATYTLALGPSNGATFPAPVTLSLSGLPPGATGTLTPNTLPTGSSLTNVTLTIQLPQITADLERKPPLNRPISPVFLGLLLLPFVGRMRRLSKRLNRMLSVLLLLAAGIAAMGGLSGCGTASGFFGKQQETYTVTITATSGALSHSATVTLTVE